MFLICIINTSWHSLIVSPKHFQVGRRKIIMILAIILLYIIAIIDFSVHWCLVNYAFVKNGWNFWKVFLGLQATTSTFFQRILVIEIDGMIATIIADIIMVSYCEVSIMWRVISCSFDHTDLAMLDCLESAMVNSAFAYSLHPYCNRFVTCMSLSSFQLITDNGAAKGMYIYHFINDSVSLQHITSYDSDAIWAILYASFSLSTTILCTILIIYQIIKVVIRTEHGRAGIQSYRGTIEILVESAFLYSFVLLLFVICVACKISAANYVDIVASMIRVRLLLPSELKSLHFYLK